MPASFKNALFCKANVNYGSNLLIAQRAQQYIRASLLVDRLSFSSKCKPRCLSVRVHAVNCIKHAAEFRWGLTSLLRPSCLCRFTGRMKPKPVVVFL